MQHRRRLAVLGICFISFSLGACGQRASAQSDSSLEATITGTWFAAVTGPDPGDYNQLVFDYKPDHSVTVTVLKTPAHRAKSRIDGHGTWSVKNGSLEERIDWPGSNPQVSVDRVVSVSAESLVLKSNGAKDEDRLTRLSASNAGTIAEILATPTDADNQSATIIDSKLYVPAEDVKRIAFVINKPAQARLILDIDNDVPLDIVTLAGNVSIAGYGMVTAARVMGSVSKALGNDDAGNSDDKDDVKTYAELFTAPLSKEAAYQHYESEWADLKPGEYTVFLDNSGDNTPSRGDAPVHALVQVRASQ